MSLRRQLELGLGDTYPDRQTAIAAKGELETIIETIGLKQAAYDLGESAATISHAFDADSRHVVKFDWLPYCLRRAPTPKLLQLLAAHAGHTTLPLEPLSDRQWREKMQQALDAFPEPVRRAVMEQAFGPGAKP